MEKVEKPVAGQKIWIEEYYRNQGEAYEAEVIKVGKQYFYAKGNWRELKFRIDSWREFYGPNDAGIAAKAYATKQVIEDNKEASAIVNDLKYKVDFRNISLDQLKRIKQILDETN